MASIIELCWELEEYSINACCNNAGDSGMMIPMGTHEHQGGIQPYNILEQVDYQKVKAASIVARREEFDCRFPIVMQGVLRSTDGLPNEDLGGVDLGGVDDMGQSFTVMSMLQNSCHIDYRDITYGEIIWCINLPGKLKNWHFVCPDVIFKKEDGTI
jgi:hypothetical protein